MVLGAPGAGQFHDRGQFGRYVAVSGHDHDVGLVG
jgi:hypothetical protein